MTSLSSILRWTAIALLGLAIAAGVAFAASKLVSQRIGLASEPLNAGKELAPPETHRPAPHPGQGSVSGNDSATSTSSGTPPTNFVTRTFTPTQPGTFSFNCSNSGCGIGHDDMIGRIVVVR